MVYRALVAFSLELVGEVKYRRKDDRLERAAVLKHQTFRLRLRQAKEVRPGRSLRLEQQSSADLLYITSLPGTPPWKPRYPYPPFPSPPVVRPAFNGGTFAARAPASASASAHTSGGRARNTAPSLSQRRRTVSGALGMMSEGLEAEVRAGVLQVAATFTRRFMQKLCVLRVLASRGLDYQ